MFKSLTKVTNIKNPLNEKGFLFEIPNSNYSSTKGMIDTQKVIRIS